VVTASSETVTVVGVDGFFRETWTMKPLSSLMLFRSADGCVVCLRRLSLTFWPGLECLVG
jgi:hypothetical protein